MPPPASHDNLRRLPLIVDLPTAARLFGIGRTLAYELARADEFPCPVRRYGRLYRVRTMDLLQALGQDGNGWPERQIERLRRLPPVIDLPSAARLFGIGRTLAYELARADEFPCPVRRYGRLYRVRTVDLLQALGLTARDEQDGRVRPTVAVTGEPRGLPAPAATPVRTAPPRPGTPGTGPRPGRRSDTQVPLTGRPVSAAAATPRPIHTVPGDA
ncbi:hypothetical protein ThrDRAFT_02837 [Frankia casuarinae]|uniref:Helix-turn-helix domain-containing protein n=1 Tax=Frankia casuarinae (strain DSM 45818 / CECT 9043 / HFP020203 / CcI3) TaxID=106370 RepID=Q2J7T5_FRACC|nr:hypothetical protein [Frankia casuarinae]ABD12657.1 hypothetical protein Francci3_3300 [Frankia casuarinae]EYT91502.1 hypothetical protein ThrDRAFT_02837 [Frankia casuarinae]